MSEDNEREIEVAEITQVMSSQSGRNVMHRLLRTTGVDEDMFNPDTHEHARNAGRRGVGLELRDELKEACIDHYFKMLKENEDG